MATMLAQGTLRVSFSQLLGNLRCRLADQLNQVEHGQIVMLVSIKIVPAAIRAQSNCASGEIKRVRNPLTVAYAAHKRPVPDPASFLATADENSLECSGPPCSPTVFQVPRPTRKNSNQAPCQPQTPPARQRRCRGQSRPAGSSQTTPSGEWGAVGRRRQADDAASRLAASNSWRPTWRPGRIHAPRGATW